MCSLLGHVNYCTGFDIDFTHVHDDMKGYQLDLESAKNQGTANASV